MRLLTTTLTLLLLAASARAESPSAEDLTFFESEVRPIFVKHCQECHGEKKQESGLRLDALSAMLTGGDSGPAVVAGDPDGSLLVHAVRQDGDVAMPPDARLPDAEIAVIERWVARGAPWPPEAKAAGLNVRSGGITAEDRDFWSFRPVQEPKVPHVHNVSWQRNDVDRFLLARIEAAGLTPNGDAGKESLLRRATLDLTGLVPTVAEIDAFLADDSPDAFAKVVDRLLASDAYGERWGRHWLDVVRYADTSGLTSDHPVPQAGRYRDYVIQAFQRDKPYDQFLREQLAGDHDAAVSVDDPARYAELITATGYLAISRRFGFEPNDDQHLTIQDTIDNVGQVMLGLSLGCARCHDHKFEPVTSHDYYALYGIFDSTHYPYPGAEYIPKPSGFAPLVPPAQAAVLQQRFDARMAELTTSLQRIDEELQALPDPQSPPDELLARRKAQQRERNELEDAGPFPMAYAVTEGGPHNARVQRRGEPDRLGEEVPRRFLEVLGGQTIPGADGWQVARLSEPVMLAAGQEYTVSVNIQSSYVASPESTLRGAPAELITFRRGVFGPSSRFPTQTFGLGYFVDVEWESASGDAANLYPDVAPAQLANEDKTSYELGTVFTAEESGWVKAIRYFRSPQEAGAHVGHLWDNDGKLLAAVEFPPLPGSGRRELADWIATADNPLTARVMVNRIWQYHFGQGLVRSENDFGQRGEAPSHPELLDFLAVRFVDDGWSVKSMHRRLMNSRAYRLSSRETPAAQERDPENRLVWRFQRRRLEAEAIRDNLLLLGGNLDRTPAPVHPFPPVHTWSFTQHNPFSAVYDHNHRSVYLMSQRIKKAPYLELFDGADPNASTPHRANTVVPGQALYMMNAPFVHEQAAGFARRLLANHDDANERVLAAYRESMGRRPSDQELNQAGAFLAHYRDELAQENIADDDRELEAWSALARVLLSSNEFIHLE